MRFSGDAVAIIAAETEAAALRAMKLIKVQYQVLDAVLDFRTAKDNPVLVHPEEDWYPPCPVGGDNRRNLVASEVNGAGDVEAVLADCDLVLDRTYHTQRLQPGDDGDLPHLHRAGPVRAAACDLLHPDRLPLRGASCPGRWGMPKSRIRVEKPRIGGGFGAKQTAVCEVYPAFVTLQTGRPAKLIYTREEAQIAGSPRHEMEVRIRLGADQDGRIRCIDLYTLSNTGAYGEHGPTTVGLSGHKSIPMYTGGLEAYRFGYDVVYTNLQAAGAYRGYGATQGIFALESIVNELAERLGHGPHPAAGQKHGARGHGHAQLLRRDRQRLRAGPLHGALPPDVPLGREIPGAGHGQRQGARRRRGHGDAGVLHFPRGRGAPPP